MSAESELTESVAWTGVDTLDVIRRLRSENAEESAAALDELQRRGLDESQLALARRLTDPDPAVRLEFAQSLPDLAEIDTDRWLLWLSFDPHPEVRRTAVAWMATRSRARLDPRLREIERNDSDDRVRRQAEKALGGRSRN